MASQPLQTPSKPAPRRRKGFVKTAGLIQPQLRTASEKRGFAQMRLLTHWAEIVGEETAKRARPVKVSYGREGFGATLTVLTTGSMAPILQAESPKIREKVNACYGYSAISHIRITQTAPSGFAEGQIEFEAKAPVKKVVSPETRQAAAEATEGVHDDSLRLALAALGENVLSRRNKS